MGTLWGAQRLQNATNSKGLELLGLCEGSIVGSIPGPLDFGTVPEFFMPKFWDQEWDNFGKLSAGANMDVYEPIER